MSAASLVSSNPTFDSLERVAEMDKFAQAFLESMGLR
jgi:hypothetical protein